LLTFVEKMRDAWDTHVADTIALAYDFYGSAFRDDETILRQLRRLQDEFNRAALSQFTVTMAGRKDC
jgi:hypothetical protein